MKNKRKKQAFDKNTGVKDPRGDVYPEQTTGKRTPEDAYNGDDKHGPLEEGDDAAAPGVPPSIVPHRERK